MRLACRPYSEADSAGDVEGHVSREDDSQEAQGRGSEGDAATNPTTAWGKEGRVVFVLRRSKVDPNEFRMDETWESEKLTGEMAP